MTDHDQLKSRIRDVVSQFVELKKSSGEWKGLCPFHEEKTPSFCVNETKGVFLCRGCGATGDVFSFIERLEGMPDFPSTKKRVSELAGWALPHETLRVNGAGSGKGSSGRVVASYVYTDQRGTPQFRVVRMAEPKRFFQEHPSGKGWAKRRGNARLVLYRLSAVIEGKEVWVVEGEKDVETAERLGFIATTNAGGSSQPWLESYTETLAGKRVIVCGDTDEPGRKHTDKVVAALSGRAAEVVKVDLPAPHKDLSDFVDAGNGRDDLLALIERATEEAKNPWPQKQGFLLLVGIKHEPITWLVPDLIPESGLTVLAGTPGSLKSTLVLSLAAAVANGESFAQLKACDPRPVLVVDRENTTQFATHRRKLLGIVRAPSLYWVGGAKADAFRLDDPGLLAWAKEARPLLAFDSLIRFLDGANENDNTEVAEIMDKFKRLRDVGATVVVIAHASPKNDHASRGATEIQGAPDNLLRCDRNDRVVQVASHKGRFSPEKTHRFRLTQEFGFESLMPDEAPFLNEGRI